MLKSLLPALINGVGVVHGDLIVQHWCNCHWPAPGAPELAAEVAELLGKADFDTAFNHRRGFDHGVFIPLKLVRPEADMPVLQLSLRADMDPQAHLELGRVLAPLREQGVLIVGSGMSFHNIPLMRANLATPAPAVSARSESKYPIIAALLAEYEER